MFELFLAFLCQPLSLFSSRFGTKYHRLFSITELDYVYKSRKLLELRFGRFDIFSKMGHVPLQILNVAVVFGDFDHGEEDFQKVMSTG